MVFLLKKGGLLISAKNRKIAKILQINDNAGVLNIEIDNKEYTVPTTYIGNRLHYLNHCWRCQTEVSSLFCEKCSLCGWYICNGCGSCRQDGCMYSVNGFRADGIHRNGTRYSDEGYDCEGFNSDGVHKNGTLYSDSGYDREGYDRKGYNCDGYDRDGYDRTGYNREGYDRQGYDHNGYDSNGYNRAGFNIDGVHKNGTMYSDRGYNCAGYDCEGYNIEGYNGAGYDREGYDHGGYDSEGYDRKGYDCIGFDRSGVHKNGTLYSDTGYNRRGYDRSGYDRDGYNREGYDINGYNREGYNREGYNQKGYDKDGYHSNGYNRNGYDRDGFDRSGFDKNGYDREGYDAEGFDRNGIDRNGLDRKGLSEYWRGLVGKKVIYILSLASGNIEEKEGTIARCDIMDGVHYVDIRFSVDKMYRNVDFNRGIEKGFLKLLNEKARKQRKPHKEEFINVNPDDQDISNDVLEIFNEIQEEYTQNNDCRVKTGGCYGEDDRESTYYSPMHPDDD